VYCLCVNVHCTAATGCQPKYSKHTYQIVPYRAYHMVEHPEILRSAHRAYLSTYAIRHCVIFSVQPALNAASVQNFPSARLSQSLLFIWKWWGLAWGQFGRSVKLMTFLHLGPNVKKNGDVFRDEAERTLRQFQCFVCDFLSDFKRTGWCKSNNTV
jgi:hypothetical protein